MTLVVSAYRAQDMRELKIQSSQEDMFSALTDAQFATFEKLESWTARIDGEVMLVGGLLPVWDNRAMLWSYISQSAGGRMLTLTRGVRRLIDMSSYDRLECYVDMDFQPGHRWAQMLGFKNETPNGMAAFFPNGHSAAMYSRTR